MHLEVLTREGKKLLPYLSFKNYVLGDGVKVTFLHYPFETISDVSDLNGMKVFSLEELAATKAYTLGRREEMKDYIDLYFLIKENHCGLNQILDLAKKKFASDFNDRLFLEQIIDIDSIPETSITLLREKNLSKMSIKKYFQEKLQELQI